MNISYFNGQQIIKFKLLIKLNKYYIKFQNSWWDRVYFLNQILVIMVINNGLIIYETVLYYVKLDVITIIL